MKRTHYLFICILLLISGNASCIVQRIAAFDWITPIEVPVHKSIPGNEIEEGSYYMLFDRQFNIPKKINFYHYAYKLTSENGVQNNSEIEIVYNPAFQKLYIHSIKVYRKGKYIDYTQKSKIKELQREEELEYHIYDETLTCYIILEDIRIGDIIEYSFSIEGTNPIFGEFKYFNYRYNLNYTLLDYYLRIIKSRDLQLYFKYHNSDFKPNVITSEFGEELIWQKSNVPALKTEVYTPGWYEQYPEIEMSSCNNWQEIRDWGMTLFKVNEELSDSLKIICDQIITRYATDEQKVMATLFFVQKEIRYLGIEVGANSHKPGQPNKVFKQRYGDCKDKALLLSMMLREMGIEAYPALVSTNLTKAVNDYLPSPNNFNHAVVEVIMKDGRHIWLDPTKSYQGGDFAHYFFSDYGYGLVLNGSNSKLDTVIPNPISRIDIVENYKVKDFEGNANLKVVTTYYGYDADEFRYTLADNNKTSIQEENLNFYKNTYGKIDTSGTLRIIDDSIKNEVQVIENYIIEDFWKSDTTAEMNVLQAEVSAYEINSKISGYTKKYSKRKTPLFFEYPLHLSQTIILILPEEWKVKKSDLTVNNDFFQFRYNSFYKDSIITLQYDLTSKKDYVSANKTSRFIDDILKVDDVMAYKLTYKKPHFANTVKVDMIMVYLFMAFILLLTFGCRMFYKRKKLVNLGDLRLIVQDTIGGWVILPIIGLLFSPPMALYRLFHPDFFRMPLSQIALSQDISMTMLLNAIVIIFELLIQCYYLVIPVFLLFLAIKCDRRFPVFMIYYLAFAVGFNIIDAYLFSITSHTTSYDSGVLARSIFYAIIWIPFFKLSKRCKRIFIR